MSVIVLFIYIQKDLFCETFLYTQKSKKTNPVYVRNFFKAQIPRALLSDKNWNFAFLKKVNNSIAIKMRANLLNTRLKIKLFSAHDTFQ